MEMDAGVRRKNSSKKQREPVPPVSCNKPVAVVAPMVVAASSNKPIAAVVESGPAPALLPVGFVLKSRWRVVAQLAKGAFGEVCIADDMNTKRTVAIKSEPLDAKSTFLGMDVEVLRKLQDKKTTVPRFFACGHTERVNYCVMQLLGRTLLELKKSTPEDRFSFGTALRIADQMTRSLRDLHECGYLHRDVKPANFTVGPALESDRIVYMIDFGLCRPYLDPKTGSPLPPRPRAGFRGTPRYASIDCLKGRDVGRSDDLWSVFYVLVELMVGQLPWRRMNDKKEILECKLKWAPVDLVPSNAPYALHDLINHMITLGFDSEPDYDHLRDVYTRSMRNVHVDETSPWDWDQSIEQDDEQRSVQEEQEQSARSVVSGAEPNRAAMEL